jgi:hypothetical protein
MYNDIFNMFNNDFSKINAFYMYSKIRFEIQDTDFETDFIDELYHFYEEFFEDIDDFIKFLNIVTTALKIDLRDIDLDELAREMED